MVILDKGCKIITLKDLEEGVMALVTSGKHTGCIAMFTGSHDDDMAIFIGGTNKYVCESVFDVALSSRCEVINKGTSITIS